MSPLFYPALATGGAGSLLLYPTTFSIFFLGNFNTCLPWVFFISGMALREGGTETDIRPPAHVHGVGQGQLSRG